MFVCLFVCSRISPELPEGSGPNLAWGPLKSPGASWANLIPEIPGPGGYPLTAGERGVQNHLKTGLKCAVFKW